MNMSIKKRTKEVEKKEPTEWVSAKIPKETYDKLKEQGVGIGEAIKTLVEAKQESFEKKMVEISDVGADLADALLKSGLISIRFAGLNVTGIEENGTQIVLNVAVRIDVGDSDTRATILQIIKDKLEGEENGGLERYSEESAGKGT